MKKIISIVLLLTLCLGLFAGCGDNGNTTTAPADSIKSDLANAKLILRNRYDTAGKDQENKILADKELITVVVVGENSFKVDWTVKVTAGNADDAKIVAAETANTVKLDVNEKPTEELHFTLTATISDGANNTETLTLKCFTPAKAGPAGPAKPVAGTAYKMYMYQTKLAKALYFNGQMSDKYLATTENVDEAVDIFVEEVDGGYHMYFMNGDTKTYIDIVLREGETKKTNVVLVTEPTCVYTWSESLEIFVTHVGEADFFLGTYGTYNTMSPSSTYYITDANAEKIGTEQFLAYLYTKDNLPETPVVDPTEPTEPSTPDNPTEPVDPSSNLKPITTAPVVGTAYKFGANNGSDIFFIGEHKSADLPWYLLTSTKSSEGIDVKLEAVDGVEGGYRLCFEKDGKKIYVRAYERSDKAGSATLELTETVPTEYYTYSTEHNTLIFTLGESQFFLCSQGTYGTIGVSSISKITDATTYACHFYAEDKGGNSDTNPGETAYKFGMVQENKDNTVYYLAGGMNGFYMATTDDANAALDVYLETTTGGYYLYCYVDGAKTYINMVVSGTHVNGAYEATASTVYTLDSERNILVANVEVEGESAEYTFGTRNDNTYTTVGPVKVAYNGFWCKLTTGKVDIKPTEPTEPADGTVNVVIADYADANGWTSTTLYNEIKINADITVTVSGTPNGEWGLNSGKYYENGENWRIYQNESPAIVIKAAEGKTIVSVKITYAVKNDGVLTNGDTQVESGTVIAVNGNSITLSVGNTGTKTNGQVQITAIEVIYA